MTTYIPMLGLLSSNAKDAKIFGNHRYHNPVMLVFIE